jgi:hypothetical protein
MWHMLYNNNVESSWCRAVSIRCYVRRVAHGQGCVWALPQLSVLLAVSCVFPLLLCHNGWCVEDGVMHVMLAGFEVDYM